MKHEIVGNPDYGDLTVTLDPGDEIQVESGAMSRMTTGMEVKARCMGGVLQALIRKVFGGESLFVAEYTAPSGGFISAAPKYPGTILHRKISGETFFLTAGSFLGCTKDVEVHAIFGGFKALFTGEGAFLLRCQGHGELFYSAFGGVIEREVNGELTVDTGHLVGFESSLDYSIGGMGNLKSTFLSGEGLVMKFSGSGKIYLQTRNLGGLVGWLSPFCIG